MKKLILGLVVGMMIGSATVSLAAENDIVEAIFAKFNLVINGQQKELETTPLVYNGTSYLPVRDMANLVGYDVTYKADSRTIELTTPAPKSSEPAVSRPPVERGPDLTGWTALSVLAKKYDVTVTTNEETTVIEKGTTSLTFPLGFRSDNSANPLVLLSDNGRASLMVYDAMMYLNADGLKQLGINQ